MYIKKQGLNETHSSREIVWNHWLPLFFKSPHPYTPDPGFADRRPSIHVMLWICLVGGMRCRPTAGTYFLTTRNLGDVVESFAVFLSPLGCLPS